MPRPCCLRRIEFRPTCTLFKPAGIPARDLEWVELAADESEAIRLADLEGLYQEEAAERMGISRPTFSRIVEQARRKVAMALIHGKALLLAVHQPSLNEIPKGETIMPNGDGTGPLRRGRGKGQGPCGQGAQRGAGTAVGVGAGQGRCRRGGKRQGGMLGKQGPADPSLQSSPSQGNNKQPDTIQEETEK